MRRTILIILASGMTFSVITTVLMLVASKGGFGHESTLEFAKNTVSDALQFTQHLMQVKKRATREAVVEVPCSKKSRNELRALMGPAYNRHYFSDVRPVDFFTQETREMESVDPNPFHVAENFRNIIVKEDNLDFSKYNFSRAEFAEEIVNVTGNVRQKRQDYNPRTQGRTIPWLCKWHIQWVDMGEDTFPRYMRSVTCSEETCWFDRMSCYPRAFVVVVLKRKKSRCFAMQHVVDEIFPKRNKRHKSNHLPPELQEEWEFEERAANFCCECVYKMPV